MKEERTEMRKRESLRGREGDGSERTVNEQGVRMTHDTVYIDLLVVTFSEKPKYSRSLALTLFPWQP